MYLVTITCTSFDRKVCTSWSTGFYSTKRSILTSVCFVTETNCNHYDNSIPALFILFLQWTFTDVECHGNAQRGTGVLCVALRASASVRVRDCVLHMRKRHRRLSRHSALYTIAEQDHGCKHSVLVRFSSGEGYGDAVYSRGAKPHFS